MNTSEVKRNLFFVRKALLAGLYLRGIFRVSLLLQVCVYPVITPIWKCINGGEGITFNYQSQS